MLCTAVSGQATWLPRRDEPSLGATWGVSNGGVLLARNHDDVQLPNQLQNIREIKLHLVGVGSHRLDRAAQNRIIVGNRLLHDVATRHVSPIETSSLIGKGRLHALL